MLLSREGLLALVIKSFTVKPENIKHRSQKPKFNGSISPQEWLKIFIMKGCRSLREECIYVQQALLSSANSSSLFDLVGKCLVRLYLMKWYLQWGWLLNQIITNYALPFDSIIIIVISINAHYIKNINKLDRKYSKFQNVRQFRNFPGFSLNISVPFCELIPNFELSSLKTARLWLWRSKIQPLVTHCRVNIAGQLVRGGSHLVEHSLHHFWTAHTSQ